MTLALVALVLAAPCEHPSLSALGPERRDAACRLLSQAPAAPPARQALEAVYQREGFERARVRDGGALQAYLAQARAWLERLFETSGARTYSKVTRVAVLLVAVLTGVAAVARLAARRRRRARAGAPPDGPAPLTLSAPGAHLARAQAALASDPRGAIREGLLALLSHLERQRLARPDRVTTNRELARALAARGAPPAMCEAVTRLLGWYDDAFYSLEPVAEGAARGFVDEVSHLIAPEAAP
jgi:hypothetical protein